MFIPVRPEYRRVRSSAIGPFLVVVGFVRVRSAISVQHGVCSCAFCPFPQTMGIVHSRTPCRSSGSFLCFRPITLRPRCRRLRSVHSGDLGVVGFVRVHSVHSRQLLVSSCSIRCVLHIAVGPGGRRGRLGPFDQFPCALGGVGFVRVCSDHSSDRRVR